MNVEAQFHIREAQASDARAISVAHVQAWQESYRNIIGASYLQSLAPESREKMWADRLKDPSFDGKIYVAETSDKEIVGFIGVGPSRSEEFKNWGELRAIYLVEEFKGQGIGRALFLKGKEWLVNQGFDSFFCWVLKENPTRRFYESTGGVITKFEKPINIGGTPLLEVAYEWVEAKTS